MLRDGGSLAATFQGADAAEYWLLLQVRVRELPSGRTERLGYEPPYLLARETGLKTHISWEHAWALLNQARSMVRTEQDGLWLQHMAEAVRGRGQLPAGIAALL